MRRKGLPFDRLGDCLSAVSYLQLIDWFGLGPQCMRAADRERLDIMP